MRKLAILGGLLASTLAAPPAFATSEIELLDSPCDLATSGCLFSGNVTEQTTPEIQADYNALQDPDIVLNSLSATGDDYFDAGETSGGWSLPGFIVDYIAVKAGNDFVLYSVVPGASSGSWTTAGLTNPRGGLKGLSHLAFFGSPGVVPEPASWAMMIAGFGLTGAAMRRRKTRVAVTYA